MTEIRVVRCLLEWERPFLEPIGARHLRGAFGRAFPEEVLLHQHLQDKTLYRYPRVHFRVFQDKALLVGFQEGAELLLELPMVGLALELNRQENSIVETHMLASTHQICPAERLRRYTFLSPWLALNQERYPSYRKMPWHAQESERDRLAVAGILTALRGLGVEVEFRLMAAVEEKRVELCHYKGNSLHGILGNLVTNVDLPEHLGLGKASSHGFGWLVSHDNVAPFD